MKRMLRAWNVDDGSRQKRMGAHCVESGWTTSHLKIAIRQSIPFLHETCFILIGLNDVLQHIPLHEIKSNLLAIINILNKSGKSSILSTLPPTLNQCPNQQAEIKEINVFIQSLQTKNIFTLHFHKHFPPFSPITNNLYQLKYSDGRPDHLHLSMKGFRLLISLINDSLSSPRRPIISSVTDTPDRPTHDLQPLTD